MDDKEQPQQSLLPYDEWTEEALRHVMRRARACPADIIST